MQISLVVQFHFFGGRVGFLISSVDLFIARDFSPDITKSILSICANRTASKSERPHFLQANLSGPAIPLVPATQQIEKIR
mmetsp:Transcript_31568/g.60307  ORF Transcript_31568/g.60307 Transcript_31568/m.60307 type:complete len:80 (-) Transcript_31568:48-287(-)